MKEFKTYNGQIEILSQKGLIIDDCTSAINLLKKLSYFNLINGYKAPFKKNDTYKKNTHFSDIYYLYQFDDELRHILMKYILMVELHIKSLLSYTFCENYGSKQSEYLNVMNYNYEDTKLQENIKDLVHVLELKINDKNKPHYLKHQADQQNIPLWALVKTLSLGNISKMYSLQKDEIKSKISHEFQNVDEKSLGSMLNILTRFRNVCAHNERLFDFNYNKCTLPQNDISDHFSIINNNANLFGVIIILKFLLDKDDFSNLKNEICNAIDSLFEKTNQIQKLQLLKLMGFPKNWEEIEKL